MDFQVPIIDDDLVENEEIIPLLAVLGQNSGSFTEGKDKADIIIRDNDGN